MLKSNDLVLLDNVVEQVSSSVNYKQICPDLVRSIAAQELVKRCNLKEALKATKNKLHQIGGAYLDSQDDYNAWLEDLCWAVQTGNKAMLQQLCKQIMSHHASTKERLPILDQFYMTIFADLAPISSILDLACGLNPLTLPWMPLPQGTHYYAYDIYQHIMDFLHEWLVLVDIKGQAHVCDIIQNCPTQEVDVALLLKAIPCLEQVDKHIGHRLLRAIHAKHIVVSFPIYSLGGKGKGMAVHYETHFRQLVDGEQWMVRKFEFTTELVFVVTK